MDYRKFLGKEERLLFPYLGGPTVEGHGRLLRVKERPAKGWHVFRVVGRNAWPVEPASAPDEAGVPVVRGHQFGGFLFAEGGYAGELELTGEGELEAFAPCKAYRWGPNDLILAGVDFESEAEGQVREALEEMRPLTTLRGVAGTLRLAYGFAVLARRARQLETFVTPAEAAGQLVAVAEMGQAQANAVLQRILQERALAAARARAPAPAPAPAPPAPHVARAVPVAPEPAPALTEAQQLRQLRREIEAEGRERQRQRQQHRAAPRASERAATRDNAAERAEDVLEAAGARPDATRLLDSSRLEVRFRFMNNRFVTVVDPLSLQVLDAGICLAGADRMVTLDSLPSVIREAIQTSRLVITRR